MDFIIGLPMTLRKKDAIWVVVDRLTNSAHFIPTNQKYSYDKLAELYLERIVSIHGVLKTITSDRVSVFTSSFWKSHCWAFLTSLPKVDLVSNSDNGAKKCQTYPSCHLSQVVIPSMT